MAAIEVGAELHFIDREEGHIDLARHGLDGGNPITGIGRLDFLFAGDERDSIGSHALGDLVVDFTRQEPQRQPDDAR
jgi:hypothetical protein